MDKICDGARLSSIEAEALALLATAAVKGEYARPLPEGIDHKKLYRIAKNNYIIGIVYRSVSGLAPDSIPAERLEKWRTETAKQAAYAVIQSSRRGEVAELLEKNKIGFVGLKGYVLERHYPENTVRSCADIDICVRSSDRTRTRKILLGAGYQETERGANHDTFEKNGVFIEIHHRLYSETPIYFKYFEGLFDRMELASGREYEYVMSNTDFAVFQAVHDMRHFTGGGLGFRALLDHYVTEKNLPADREKLYSALESLGILRFYHFIHGLTDKVFFDKALTEDEAFVLDYMVNGGIFGTEINNASMKQSEYTDGKGSTTKYVMQRTFLSFYDMSIRYPVLKKAPVLLPFCHIHRWGKAMLGNRNGIKGEINASRAVTAEDIEEKRRLKAIIGYEDK